MLKLSPDVNEFKPLGGGGQTYVNGSRRATATVKLEAMLESLPTLAPRCIELDLTGALASDEAVARVVRRLPR